MGVWELPVTDMLGKSIKIRFYITPGKGVLLVGNKICHKSYLMGPEDLLVIPPGVKMLSKNKLYLETYSEPTSSSDPDAVRTYFYIVPSKRASFKTFFASHRSLASITKYASMRTKLRDGKVSRRFANKLHFYTHLHFDDMVLLCERVNVLNPILKQALSFSFRRCTSCEKIGRPLSSKKVSFEKILATFNQNVQVDFLFIKDVTKEPVLHIVDTHTALSVAAIVPSRKMEVAARQFEYKWINVHGAPKIVSGDLEFLNTTFLNAIRYFGCEFEQRPARRHNKLGVVERKNSIIRVMAQRVHSDAKFFSVSKGSEFMLEDILSRATYLANILYGSKALSSFEMARGYKPSITGLPKIKLTDDILEAHEEQQARRPLSLLEKSKTPRPVNPSKLSRDDQVYFFKRGPKLGTWEIGYVRSADDQSVSLSSARSHKGKPIRAAYEDVRLAPSSPLLRDLDEIDFVFPRYYSIVDEEALDIGTFDDEPLSHLFDSEQMESRNRDQPPPAEHELLPDLNLSSVGYISQIFDKEESMWANHPSAPAFLSMKTPRKLDQPQLDIGSNSLRQVKALFTAETDDLTQSFEPPQPEKSVGSTPIISHQQVPHFLQSSEQKILEEIRSVIGDRTASESILQFAPRWILQKAIDKELSEYRRNIEEVDIRILPRDANIISSHHFFQIKHDGQEGSLKLKCRLVPHGNPDRDKDSIRSDSSTAQIHVIRIVLSIAAP